MFGNRNSIPDEPRPPRIRACNSSHSTHTSSRNARATRDTSSPPSHAPCASTTDRHRHRVRIVSPLSVARRRVACPPVTSRLLSTSRGIRRRLARVAPNACPPPPRTRTRSHSRRPRRHLARASRPRARRRPRCAAAPRWSLARAPRARARKRKRRPRRCANSPTRRRQSSNTMTCRAGLRWRRS